MGRRILLHERSFSTGLFPLIDGVLVCIQVYVPGIPHGDSLDVDVSGRLSLDVANHINP